jgi:hypothetical protein
VIYGWDPDVPVPEGYELDSDLNGGLLASGIALLGSSWTISVLVAVAATGVISNEDEDEPADADRVTAADWSPLYIPVAGPFVSIHTLRARGAGLGMLLADGLVQIAGVAGIIGGVLDREYKLIPSQMAELGLAPVLGGSMQGLCLTGRFQ